MKFLPIVLCTFFETLTRKIIHPPKDVSLLHSKKRGIFVGVVVQNSATRPVKPSSLSGPLSGLAEPKKSSNGLLKLGGGGTWDTASWTAAM